MNKYLKFLLRNHLFLGIYAYCLVSWIWILQIDLGRLATTAFAGKLMQIVTLLALTGISALIYTKSIRKLSASIKRTKHSLVPLQLVMWWAATELFVAWAICIIWYGVGARFDNVLPFTSLSHITVWTPLSFLSRFAGINGMSGVLFMLIFLVVKPSLRRLFIPAFSVVVLATFTAWVLYRTPNGPEISVFVVTERNEQDTFNDIVVGKDKSLVVFPEYGFTDIENETIASKVRAENSDETTYFVSSRFVTEGDSVRNQLVAGDTREGYSHMMYKSRLIPGGEYLPYATVLLMQVISAEHVLDNFRETREITKAEGTPQQMLLDLDGIRVGAGICSSIIAPEDYRNLAKDGANIFTNSAFLGIFNGSTLYELKHRSMAKSMAVANARVFVQSASSGPSFAYDGNGRTIFDASNTGVTEIKVTLNTRRTPYSMLGEVIAMAGFVWIGFELWKTRNKR